MASEDENSAADFLPENLSMAGLRRSARGCRGCPLYRDASQTVFGEGLVRSRLMLVGEMPGDREDLEGKPFVGPAGRILDEGLEEAGIERADAYVTNVVKHFKFEVVEPEVVLALGATAAKTLLGSDFRVSRERGKFVDSPLATHVTATIHPSAVLRRPSDEERREEMGRFIEDLRTVERRLNGGA